MKFLYTLVLILIPTFVFAEDDPSTKIIILLDTSSSMQESMQRLSVDKMSAAKNAIISVLGDIPDTTQLGIMTFNGWVYKLGPLDRNKITQVVNDTEAYGATPLGEYMEFASNALLSSRQKSHDYGIYKLLVVTDGEASDQWLVDQNLKDILRRGIVLDVIGVDMRSNHTLSAVAHQYMSADDPQSLKQAIVSSVAEISTDNQDLADDWELLAAVPDDAALQIIEHLTKAENQPIGKEADVAPVAEEDVQTAPVKTSSFWYAFKIITIVLAVSLVVLFIFAGMCQG